MLRYLFSAILFGFTIPSLASAGVCNMDTKELSNTIEGFIRGDIDIFQMQNIDGCDDNFKKVRVSFGYTPMTLSALYGNNVAINFFSKHGNDIDELDDNNITPLFAAARKGKISTINLLLSLGANPNILCTNHKHSALFESMLWDFQNIASVLIDKGSDVNLITKSGLTPLHIAAYRNLQGTAELLLKKGADKEIKDNEGKTPIDYAIENSNKQISLMLKNQLGKVDYSENDDLHQINEEISLSLGEEISFLRFARENGLQALLDEAVIKFSSKLQYFMKSKYKYQYDSTLRDATEKNLMNCQSMASGFLAFFQEEKIPVSAIMYPGHISIAYKMSEKSIMVIDDIIKVIADYDLRTINGMNVIYSKDISNEGWAIIGDASKMLMASYFQMMSLKNKRDGNYDIAASGFKKAINYLPAYPDFHYGYSWSLRLIGKNKEADEENRQALHLLESITKHIKNN